MIEVSFTPTAKDYAHATRWINRRSLGPLRWIFWAAIASVAVAGAFGFMLLLDAALSSPDPERADQGLAGAVLFVGVLYLGLFLKLAMRRYVNRQVYREDGFFTSPRTLILSESGIDNNSRQQKMHIPWQDVIGIHESKHSLFFQTEPAFTLFIPKRIAKDADEVKRLRDYAEKMRAESAARP